MIYLGSEKLGAIYLGAEKIGKAFLGSELVYNSDGGGGGGVIVFADAAVKSICVSHWDTSGDGELDTNEAAVVTTLNTYFRNNTSITSFDELQYFTGLTKINGGGIFVGAFDGCTNLESIVLPASVTEVQGYAFRSCSKLTDINLGGLSVIGAYAFNGCSLLASVDLSSCTTINNYGFGSCGLASVVLPAMVTLGTNAFRYCSSLARADIGSGCTSIDQYAFGDCSALVSCIVRATTPPTLGTNVFSRTNASLKIYVPYSADHSVLAAYQAANNWSGVASKIYELDSNGNIPT